MIVPNNMSAYFLASFQKHEELKGAHIIDRRAYNFSFIVISTLTKQTS